MTLANIRLGFARRCHPPSVVDILRATHSALRDHPSLGLHLLLVRPMLTVCCSFFSNPDAGHSPVTMSVLARSQSLLPGRVGQTALRHAFSRPKPLWNALRTYVTRRSPEYTQRWPTGSVEVTMTGQFRRQSTLPPKVSYPRNDTPEITHSSIENRRYFFSIH